MMNSFNCMFKVICSQVQIWVSEFKQFLKCMNVSLTYWLQSKKKNSSSFSLSIFKVLFQGQGPRRSTLPLFVFCSISGSRVVQPCLGTSYNITKLSRYTFCLPFALKLEQRRSNCEPLALSGLEAYLKSEFWFSFDAFSAVLCCAESRSILCDPMDCCSLPGFSVYGVFQERIL